MDQTGGGMHMDAPVSGNPVESLREETGVSIRRLEQPTRHHFYTGVASSALLPAARNVLSINIKPHPSGSESLKTPRRPPKGSKSGA